jgi:hypothetical protein
MTPEINLSACANLFGELPHFFKDEDELRRLWSRPDIRFWPKSTCCLGVYKGQNLICPNAHVVEPQSDYALSSLLARFIAP